MLLSLLLAAFATFTASDILLADNVTPVVTPAPALTQAPAVTPAPALTQPPALVATPQPAASKAATSDSPLVPPPPTPNTGDPSQY